MTRCPRCQRRISPHGECPVHGRPSALAVAASVLPDPIAPAGYELDQLIAVGGSSIVYSLAHPSGTPAILKWGRYHDREARARFAREAEILRELGPPTTPALFSRSAPGEWPYLVMENVPGETLAHWMSRAGANGALRDIVSILVHVAHAIHALHERGYVHRDLKPENIVLGDQGARLLDFGLATREGEAVTTNAVFGTAHYLAPEQLRPGTVIDRRTDIYALGVIAYEMFAGQAPFAGERRAIEYQHQLVRPAALRDLRAVPTTIEELVLACLAKQPEARPQDARALADRLAQISVPTGEAKEPRSLGARDTVVLAWIEGGDPVANTRAINDVHGAVVRSRPGFVLAAFASQLHDAPVAVALAACRELASDRCRIVLHVASVLVRRSATGKASFYGPEVEQPAAWTPSTVFTGIVLTAAAAEHAPTLVVAARDVPRFFRDARRERTGIVDGDGEVRLVGRDRVVQEIGAIAQGGGMVVGLFGPEGTGKSRVLATIIERLRGTKRREVIAIRGRRRLLGDRADDARLLDALGGSDDLARALADVGARGAVVVIDDAHLFSEAARRELLRDDVMTSRVLASREPLFDVTPGVTKRLAIELVPLSHADSEQVLRELLHPARLLPDVLLQRLAVRAAGNPGLLVALARDIKHRGGVRRHAGSDDWYVAADEIDTLLVAPSAAWLAARGLEGLPVDVAPIVRACTALGPQFCADEVAAVTRCSDAIERLSRAAQAGVVAERNGWFELVDAGLQDAIYDHALDEKSLVHHRALHYWLANRSSNLVGWHARLLHHATGCDDHARAASAAGMLARYARERGEGGLALALEERAQHALALAGPGSTHVDTIPIRHER